MNAAAPVRLVTSVTSATNKLVKDETLTPLTLGIFQHFNPNGMTGGSWRHPDNRSIDYLDINHWVQLGKKLEDAGFDFLFFADSYGYPTLNDRVIDLALTEANNIPGLDPVVLLSAIAAATERLGIVSTASTIIDKPQVLARRFATLDHLTNGRIGWNIVTGSGQASSARLFGEEMTPHDQRYAIAEDHVQLSLKLLEGSWEDDAVKADKEAGIYADSSKVHEIDHDGPYFKAHGLLMVPPSPQRTPVLFQAGTSGAGRNFAAQYAEAVFLSGGEPEHVATNIADIRRRAVGYGRSADSIKFLVGASFITAPTEEEALAKREEMLSFTTIENAATKYAFFTGLDLLSMDLDKPLAGVKTEQGQSNLERFSGERDAPVPTVREILEEYRQNGINGSVFVGDPQQIVDMVEKFIGETKADGFLIQPYLTPGTYDDFIELILPVMRERGLAKTEFEGTTLREHLFGEGNKRLPSNHPGAQYRTPLAPSPEEI